MTSSTGSTIPASAPGSTTPRDANQLTVVQTRIAYDAHVSDLTRQLYIALCGEGAWSHAIEVSTASWAERLRVTQQTIQAALRRLSDRRYVVRSTRPGARTQQVQAVAPDSQEKSQ